MQFCKIVPDTQPDSSFAGSITTRILLMGLTKVYLLCTSALTFERLLLCDFYRVQEIDTVTLISFFSRNAFL